LVSDEETSHISQTVQKAGHQGHFNL